MASVFFIFVKDITEEEIESELGVARYDAKNHAFITFIFMYI